MRIEDEFRVALPPGRLWPVLLDVPSVAPCLPGAEITGEHDGVYDGVIKVRIGPLGAEFAGTATLAEVDEAGRRVVIETQGRERRGAGVANATIEAVLRADGDGTAVSVRTELSITGRLAQFGSVALRPVSAALTAQFARNLQERLSAESPR